MTIPGGQIQRGPALPSLLLLQRPGSLTIAVRIAVSSEVSSQNLEDSFKEDLLSLPCPFSSAPSLWIDFVRRWGRFLVQGGHFGGVLIVDMMYKDGNMDAYAERALDSFYSSQGLVGVGIPGKIPLRSSQLISNRITKFLVFSLH